MQDFVQLLKQSRQLASKLEEFNHFVPAELFFPKTEALSKQVIEFNHTEVRKLSQWMDAQTHKRKAGVSYFPQSTLGLMNPLTHTSFESCSSNSSGGSLSTEGKMAADNSEERFFTDTTGKNEYEVVPMISGSSLPMQKKRKKDKVGNTICGHFDSKTLSQCTTKAIGSSGLCKRHGGGKRCKVFGCSKASQGKNNLCVAHGGGKRCSFSGCEKLARGKTNLCIPHGGGTRCEHETCGKLAQGGTKFCIKHGGGKRCSHVETVIVSGNIVKTVHCDKSAVSSTVYCVAHGGGKRCATDNCDKSAVGGTGFCVRHGGGRRCTVDECGKSAVGKSPFCISHGGSR